MKKHFIIYYGILQSLHIIFLIILLGNSSWVFGFLNNTAEWSEQFVTMFKAISVIDMINAFASLWFVKLFLNNDQRATKIGIVVLTVSVYSALIFGLAVFWNQLHIGNEMLLNLFSIPFLPVFYMWWKFVFKTNTSNI